MTGPIPQLAKGWSRLQRQPPLLDELFPTFHARSLAVVELEKRNKQISASSQPLPMGRGGRVERQDEGSNLVVDAPRHQR